MLGSRPFSLAKGVKVLGFAGLSVYGALGFYIPAAAQTSLERFERRLDQIQREAVGRFDSPIPAEQRVLFEYGAFVIFNFVTIDDPGQETHVLRQTDGNVWARLNFDDVHEFFVRARTSYRDFNSGDSFAGKGDDWIEPTLDRGHYRFDLARHLAAYEGKQIDGNIVVQGGRQLIHWGNGLALSWEIDGGVTTTSYGPLTVQSVVGQTRNSTIDIDSSRPGFDGDTERNFFGGMLSWDLAPEHQPFVYGLVQKDENDRDFSPDPFAPARVLVPSLPVLPTRFHYDSFYIGAGSTGHLSDQILYAVEVVYEGGNALSNSFDDSGASIPQTEEDIKAFAVDVRLDYLFHDANKTRAMVEVILASGDDDRAHTTNTFGGNRSGTDDNAFNAFGLVNTGLAFAPSASNILLFHMGISTFPMPNSGVFDRLQVGLDFFVFNKLDEDAPIDEPTSDDIHLGVEPDIFANWQITSDVTLSIRYGVFFPGSSIMTDSDARHLFFTGVTYAF